MTIRLLVFIVVLVGFFLSCDDPDDGSRPAESLKIAGQPEAKKASSNTQRGVAAMQYEIVKTDEEWRKILTPEQFKVAREKGTEQAFTGEYWNTKTDGIYQCVCCGQNLFDAKTKFDSGSGWPSYWQPIQDKNVHTHADDSLGMVRTEVLCSRCGAHLGHVFNDGPAPTGLRYCINSASLKLEEK